MPLRRRHSPSYRSSSRGLGLGALAPVSQLPLGPFNVNLHNAGDWRGARSTVLKFKSAEERNAYFQAEREQAQQRSQRQAQTQAKLDIVRARLGAEYDHDSKEWLAGIRAAWDAVDSGMSGEEAAEIALQAAQNSMSCVGKACKAASNYFTKSKTEGGRRRRKTKRRGRK